jgi:hypothetical protein
MLSQSRVIRQSGEPLISCRHGNAVLCPRMRREALGAVPEEGSDNRT